MTQARRGRSPSQRQLRVGEEIRHSLADLLQRGDLRDPDLQGEVITVTEVRISPDLTNATAFVTPLGGERQEEVLAALRRAAPFLRSQVAKAVRLRQVPRLSFELDTSFDYAQRIDRLLHSSAVARDLDDEDEADPHTPEEDIPEADRRNGTHLGLGEPADDADEPPDDDLPERG